MAELTTDPTDPELGHGIDTSPTEQSKKYLILSEEERAKGFVRPLRNKYVHRGYAKPQYPLRELTQEELERYSSFGYIKYEAFPENDTSLIGRYWTQKQLDNTEKGCGVETVMGQELSETYAREPHFYGSTYCVGCKMHLAVQEFAWSADGETVGL